MAEMETLFSDKETFTTERPISLTAKQKEAYWIAKAQEVIDNQWSDSDINAVVSDLKLLSRCDNGYERAKSLEWWSANGSYDIDMEFIAWLDDIFTDYDELVEVNQKDWVKAHGIEPLYSQGARLLCQGEIRGCFIIDQVIYINGVKKDLGKYVVGKTPTIGGYLIDYEKIHENCVYNQTCNCCGELMKNPTQCSNSGCYKHYNKPKE